MSIPRDGICILILTNIHYIMNLQFMIVIYTRFARQSLFPLTNAHYIIKAENKHYHF